MRILGVDVGRRRVGLAISDPSLTLARPLTTLTLENEDGAADAIAAAAARLIHEEEGLAAIVVGVPKRLNGTPNEETARVVHIVESLRTRVGIPIHEEDERLTSREAESRLAVRERDWRKRKEKIDRAAAAIILQDY